MKSFFIRWLPVLLPFTLYILHALVFGSWIADDAGIYFAYARNVAEGYGFVSQPGMPPVEGFSAPLWILFLSPLFILRLFDPVITPKVVAVLLALGSFITLQKILSVLLVRCGRVVLLVLTLLAMNSYFVIWTTSGMDSPLYVFLLCLLLLVTLRAVAAGAGSVRLAVLLGCLAAGVALTRADGVLYFAAFPGLLIASRLLSREERLGRADGAQLLVYAALFGALYGGYLLFRVLYFGDLYPNVYYSKGGPTLSSVVAMVTLRFRMVAKLGHLVACFGGTLGAVVLGVALLLINFRLVVTRQFNRVHGVLTVFMATAAVIYLLMPVDWMGGYRFAIPFFPFFLVYAATVLTEFLRGLAIDHRVRVGTQALMVGWVVVWSGFAFTSHSRLFRRAPVAPFARVMADAERFNGYAARLGLTGASVALADLGGNLYYSSLRVVDLAGLCDKTIARTLRKDTAAFHDYLFDEVKPTFIHLAGPWVHIAVLDSDERFRRDYVAIRELVSGGSESSGEPVLRLGDYVRRDAVFDQAEELARMQAEGRVPPVVKLTGRRSRWGELRAR